MHDAHNLDAIARLKPGCQNRSGDRGAEHHSTGDSAEFPEGPVNDAANIRPILDGEVFRLKTGLYAMFAATGCLLLIACLNIANLLVARAATRREEMAVRTALGGSSARLMRTQVMESVVSPLPEECLAWRSPKLHFSGSFMCAGYSPRKLHTHRRHRCPLHHRHDARLRVRCRSGSRAFFERQTNPENTARVIAQL